MAQYSEINSKFLALIIPFFVNMVTKKDALSKMLLIIYFFISRCK